MMPMNKIKIMAGWVLLLLFGLASCAPAAQPLADAVPQTQSPATPPATAALTATPLPERPRYAPAELVDYLAQTGDTLPALAAHFNTTVEEIRAANPEIPADATTMPPGLPMKIPIYYRPLWGSPFKILPDSAIVNGPADVGFDTEAFVAAHGGWLQDYTDYVGGQTRSGAQIVDYVAANFSVSPRVLLALLDYQAFALTRPTAPDTDYPLGYEDNAHRGLYLQLVWAANTLNNGYYGWRSGDLKQFELPDGLLERPDPWLNAGSVAVRYYFSRLYAGARYDEATGVQGLWQTYQRLFGDPWPGSETLIPGSLYQPPLQLPYETGETWAYTGGPHPGWGTGAPFAAVDFAPPNAISGCAPSDLPVVAVADGVVARRDYGALWLDLDGDGDQRTGWVVFYLHLSDAPPVGTRVKAGEPIGYPSCLGGHTTGTHIHIARKYNGEWILADGPLAFNLDGWVAENGDRAYHGYLVKDGVRVVASEHAEKESLVPNTP